MRDREKLDELRDATNELRYTGEALRRVGLAPAADAINRACEAYYEVETFYSFLMARSDLEAYEMFREQRRTEAT